LRSRGTRFHRHVDKPDCWRSDSSRAPVRTSRVTPLDIADVDGRRAVVVTAIDAEAERDWQSWEFIPAQANSSVLMRSIQDVLL